MKSVLELAKEVIAFKDKPDLGTVEWYEFVDEKAIPLAEAVVNLTASMENTIGYSLGLVEELSVKSQALEDAIDVRDAFIAKNEMLEVELKEALDILISASQDWAYPDVYYKRIGERAREFIARHDGKEKDGL